MAIPFDLIEPFGNEFLALEGHSPNPQNLGLFVTKMHRFCVTEEASRHLYFQVLRNWTNGWYFSASTLCAFLVLTSSNFYPLDYSKME